MGKKKTVKKSETPRQDAFDNAWEKFRPLVPADELEAVEQSFERPLKQSFRLNPLKTLPTDLSNRYGWDLAEIPFCPEGRRVLDAGDMLPSLTVEHRMGHFYIQDSASMLPVMLFDAERLLDKPLILDLAASPGGKTNHLAARSMDGGLILANDSSASRITALKTVMKNWGSLNHAVTNFPGEAYGGWFPNTFDLVLLDAPCSMQSLVSIDSHPMRPITEREEAALAQRQTALLESALRALKPGGQLVYSTCTLSPDEDEAVVDTMLRRFPGKVIVGDAAERLPWPASGLSGTQTKQFDPSLKGTVRLWPHRYETAGFFAALLEKTDDFGSEYTEVPQRPWTKSSFTPVPSGDSRLLSEQMSAQFGIDFPDLLEEYELLLWKRGDEVWTLPQRFLDRFDSLPAKSVGMRCASLTPGGIVWDKDWFSRFFAKVRAEAYVLSEAECAAWLGGQDIRPDACPHEKGSSVCMTDEQGIFLGIGRVSGERIRNFEK